MIFVQALLPKLRHRKKMDVREKNEFKIKFCDPARSMLRIRASCRRETLLACVS